MKIKAYWGSALFSAEEEVKVLSDDVVDITAIYPDFYANRLRFLELSGFM